MTGKTDPDRYLHLRKGHWHYKRKVPKAVGSLDGRGELVRISLKTTDQITARAMRDAYEAADDALWAALLSDDDADRAQKRYAAAVKRAEGLGFRYRSANEIERNEAWDRLAQRFESLSDSRSSRPLEEAVLGRFVAPTMTITRALHVWLDEIAAPELLTKSAQQRRKWRVIPVRAVATFVNVLGADKAVDAIDNDDARKFYKFWLGRIAPKGAKPSHTASSGNRQIGALRRLYREYFVYMGEPDRPNPFDGLAFAENKKRTRPPFPTAWIRERILQGNSLAGLNEEARAVLLIIVESGARPSEVCNLDENTILVTADVPHMLIEPREDGDDPRELKTQSSRRAVPLVGAALAAARKFPSGFPRYRESEEAFCAAANKYLRENNLTPTSKHTVYSFRHSYEDRMKEAGIDEEMRRIFFGHRRNREEYGMGGSLEWRRDQLLKVALPFAHDII